MFLYPFLLSFLFLSLFLSPGTLTTFKPTKYLSLTHCPSGNCKCQTKDLGSELAGRGGALVLALVLVLVLGLGPRHIKYAMLMQMKMETQMGARIRIENAC